MGIIGKLWNWVRGKGYAEKTTETKSEAPVEKLLETEERTQETQEPKETIEEPQETTTETRREPLATRTEEKSETQKIADQYRKTGSIQDIQKKIQTGQITTTQFQPTQELNGLNKVYTDLLKDGPVRMDNALMDIIIENRDKLVNRFSATINITTNVGQARIDIDGILAENVNDINNFISIGQTYTSEELKTQLESALNHFERTYGAIGGSIITPPEQTITIKDIQVNMTFA